MVANRSDVGAALKVNTLSLFTGSKSWQETLARAGRASKATEEGFVAARNPQELPGMNVFARSAIPAKASAEEILLAKVTA